MSSLPQDRRDTGLIVTILAVVVLVVGGLAFAASQAPTSLASRDEGTAKAPMVAPETTLPEIHDPTAVEDGAATLGITEEPGTETPDEDRQESVERGSSNESA